MNSQSCVDRESWSGEYELSWCVYSCLMQINKCSVLCTTIMRPVVTEAAIAVLTIIFPRGRGQCGVCKMREAMLHVSSFNVFMPQLSAGSAKPPRQHVYSKIVYNIGSLPPHHTTATSPARPLGYLNYFISVRLQRCCNINPTFCTPMLGQGRGPDVLFIPIHVYNLE